MGERLVPARHVDGYQQRIRAAMAAAGDVQRRHVARALSANGLTWSSPARSTSLVLFDQTQWAAAVEAKVVPVVEQIAGEILGVVRARVPQKLYAGLVNPTAQLVALVQNRALSGGPGVQRRISSGLSLHAGSWYWTRGEAQPFKVDLDKVRASIEAAPSRYGGVENPNGPGPTIADAYQAAYDQLDQLVARTSAHLSDAASAILAETMDQNTSATIQHQWNSALIETTREDHANADGDIADAGETFSLGDEEALYPGDPNLSDEQSCNCLCWLDILGVELADVPAADTGAEEAG